MEKQIIIEGKTNDWYKKAIFIVEEKMSIDPNMDLSHYAEQLIENYMKTGVYNREISKKTSGASIQSKRTDWWINAFLFISLAFLTGALVACLISFI